jgi:hypothetical protein
MSGSLESVTYDPVCSTCLASSGPWDQIPGPPNTTQSRLGITFLLFLFLRQGLALQPRLAQKSWSFCFSLPSAGITGVLHHTWQTSCYNQWCFLCNLAYQKNLISLTSPFFKVRQKILWDFPGGFWGISKLGQVIKVSRIWFRDTYQELCKVWIEYLNR